MGKFSKYWPIRSFNLAKLNINDKYPLVYQYTSRRFLDQALTTSADSLSNFNRKIVSKYKAGLGFNYLKGYLGEEVLNKSIKEFYQKNKLLISKISNFKKILTQNKDKDIWLEKYSKNSNIDWKTFSSEQYSAEWSECTSKEIEKLQIFGFLKFYLTKFRFFKMLFSLKRNQFILFSKRVIKFAFTSKLYNCIFTKQSTNLKFINPRVRRNWRI